MTDNLENVNGEFQLNPSLQWDGIFKVHFNPIMNGRYKYGKHNPEAYPEGDKPDYEYIFNTKPIAIGITAFFIKNNPHHDSPTSSLRSMLQRGDKIAIHSWYEEYYENQIASEREINETKTKAQGRLTPEQLSDTFNRNHLKSEQGYYHESEGFFLMIHSEDAVAAKIFFEYVEGYLAWVADKCNETGVGYKTEYSRERLLYIHQLLIEKGFYTAHKFMESDDFADAFSGQIIINPKPYKGSKKKLGSLIKLLTKNENVSDYKRINQVFCFLTSKPFGRNDFQKTIHPVLKSIITNEMKDFNKEKDSDFKSKSDSV